MPNAGDLDLRGAILAPDGHNEIEVIAFDAKDVIASRGLRLVWETTKQKSVEPVLYAVVAGASSFSGPPGMDLQYAAKDAGGMAAALRMGARPACSGPAGST